MISAPSALPAGGRRLLPVPPARRQVLVADREAAEALDRFAPGAAVGLPQRVDRMAPEAVEEVGVLVDGAHRGFDRLPVHLRLVVGGAARSEEDRVGEGGVVVDVGEAGQRERVFGADPGAQGADVAVGRGVLALVVALGVDHQAVGAARDRGGADLGLGDRAVAVDELPGADVDPRLVERFDHRGRELAPEAAAVAGLDVERADVVALGLGDDPRQAAALGLVDVPDPHPLAVERRAAGGHRDRAGRGRRFADFPRAAGFGGCRGGQGGDREDGEDRQKRQAWCPARECAWPSHRFETRYPPPRCGR